MRASLMHSTVGIRMPLSLVEDIHARKGNGSYANTGKRIGTRPANLLYCSKERGKQAKEKDLVRLARENLQIAGESLLILNPHPIQLKHQQREELQTRW